MITSMKTSNHQPTLSTIRMVEQKIRKRQYFKNKYQLFVNLPRQVMYPTLALILEYLEESNKIVFDKDGSIVWIFKDSGKIKKPLKDSKPISKCQK
jgi:hypothetical protein